MQRIAFLICVVIILSFESALCQWANSGSYFLPVSNDMLLQVGDKSIHLYQENEEIDDQKWLQNIEWVHLQGDVLYLQSGMEVYSLLVSPRGLDLLDQFTVSGAGKLGMKNVVIPVGLDTLAIAYDDNGMFGFQAFGESFDKKVELMTSFPKSSVSPLRNGSKHRIVVGKDSRLFFINIPDSKQFIVFDMQSKITSIEHFLPYVGLDHLQEFYWMKDPVTQRIFGVAKGRTNQYHIFDFSQGTPKPKPLSTDGGMIRYPDYTWMDFPQCYLGKVNFAPLYIRKSEIVGEKERIMLFQLKR